MTIDHLASPPFAGRRGRPGAGSPLNAVHDARPSATPGGRTSVGGNGVKWAVAVLLTLVVWVALNRKRLRAALG
ncbi:hypothetical protein GCM10009634_02450 [Saccharothrix xinjiangensis]